MIKRILSVITSTILATSLVVSAFSIPENAWYSDYLKYSIENEFIIIDDSHEFIEKQYATNLDVIKAFAKLNGEKDISDYVQYAMEKGYRVSYDNAETITTRGFAAEVFSSLIGDDEWINNITFIPDVSSLSAPYSSTLNLYNAGVLTGKTADGYFYSTDFLTVEELATITARISNKDMRISFNLPSGMTLASILDVYESIKVEQDTSEFIKFSTGYSVPKSLYDFVSFSVGETSTETEKIEVLKSFAAVNKFMDAYDYAISNEIFSQLKSEYDAISSDIKEIIANNSYPVTEYAYLINYWTTLLYEQFSYEYIFNKMPGYEDVYELYSDEYVLAKHILIAFDDDSEEAKASALKASNEVYIMACEPDADFDLLIQEYGEDPGMTYYPDGYLFTYGEMVKTFEDAAFSLEDGKISAPVESEFGYHIIKKIPLTKDLFIANEEICYNLSLSHAMNSFSFEFSEILEDIS